MPDVINPSIPAAAIVTASSVPGQAWIPLPRLEEVQAPQVEPCCQVIHPREAVRKPIANAAGSVARHALRQAPRNGACRAAGRVQQGELEAPLCIAGGGRQEPSRSASARTSASIDSTTGIKPA